MSGEFGTGKTIFVLAIVVGCFAVLWPKIFYPMLTASVTQPSSGRQEGIGPHARPERPAHLYPEMMHPALREKGRQLPQRTIEKQARPGPMPGVRPPMGGAGGIVPPPQTKGSGAMGIIMPLYTVGIVVFFVYTIMKVLFKKGQDDDKTPKLKDFGLDPEYRKYVFAEEYLDNADISTKDQMRRQVREESRNRKKAQNEVPPETKIEDEQLDQLRKRLEETEKAMERLMCQMGSVTDKLTAAKITEVLSQAQAQAKILKEEVGEMTSEEDLTSSEALTTTLSEDTSLPASLQRHLEEIQVEQLSNYAELLEGVGLTPLDSNIPLDICVTSNLLQPAATGSLDNTDFQGIGGPIPGTRTIIQLQELKDDKEEVSPSEDVPVSGGMQATECEVQAESSPGKESEEPPVSGEVVASEPPEDKRVTQPDLPTNSPEITNLTPALHILSEKADLEAEEKVVSPGMMQAKEQEEEEEEEEEEIAVAVPASKEATPKPLVEAPLVIAHELSSEGSSEATETGADISDLHSFAEENQSPGQVPAKENIEINAADQRNVAPVTQDSLEIDVESESVCKGQGTQTSFALPPPSPQIDSKEDSTQTEKEKEVAVLGMNTTFRVDEGGVETKGDSQGPVPSHQVTEILLDALLPSETQLLVRDSQVVGSSPSQDIEIECSEAGAVPCVVTSNVSLAFLGLEQRDDVTPSPTHTSTLVADETTGDNLQTEVKDGTTQEIKDIETTADNLQMEIKDSTTQENKDLEATAENVQMEAKDDTAQETKDSETVADNMQMEVKDETAQENKDKETVAGNVQMEVKDETAQENKDLETSLPEQKETPEEKLQQASSPSDVLLEKSDTLTVVQSTEVTDENKPSQICPVAESSVLETEIETPLPATQNDIAPQPLVEQVAVSQEPPVSENLEVPLEAPQAVKHESTQEGEDNAASVPDTCKDSLPVVNLPEVTVKTVQNEMAADLKSDEVSNDADLEKQKETQVALTPEEAIAKPQEETLARPSSPLPPPVPEDEDGEKTPKEVENESENIPQIPITPSLVAIAEQVASATTKAALDLLATTKPEVFLPQEVPIKSTFLTEEFSTDQSPISTDESSSATTVVAVSETEDESVPRLQLQGTIDTLVNGASSEASVYVATVTHTPSLSPSSTPETELSGEAVEAALAEAAQEETSSSSVMKPISHEPPVTQEGPCATTVSPKNEDSPTSSKGSSPDMDEYEVITKEEDQATTAIKEENSKEEAANTEKTEQTEEVGNESEDKEAEDKEEQIEAAPDQSSTAKETSGDAAPKPIEEISDNES